MGNKKSKSHHNHKVEDYCKGNNIEHYLSSSMPQDDSSGEDKVAIGYNVIVTKGSGNPDEVYEREKKLGEGSFGVVWKVKNRLTGNVAAMKIIHKHEAQKSLDLEIMNEINIIKKIDHPNVIKIFEFFNTQQHYYLLMEICEGGELFNEIIDKAPFSEEFTAFILYQIFSAIFYCHSMNITHRDIKPENILIERCEGKICRVKICDFGTSTVFEKGHVEKKVVGSSYYIAPEVLKKKYNEKCDLFSCGVLLYIMLSARPPFNGDNDKEILKKVAKCKFDMTKNPWPKVSKEAKSLITNLLTKEPEARFSAEEALNHEWFKMLKTKDRLNEIENAMIVSKNIYNLKTYKADSILQKTAVAYLVHNYPQLEEVEEAYKLFNMMDINGDGKITKEELYKGLKSYMPDETGEIEEKLIKDVDSIFTNIDADNDGTIGYEEFVTACIDKQKFLSEEVLKFAFRFFDKDNSGFITIDEIQNVFFQEEELKNCPHSEQHLKQIMEEVDLNEDGVISFEEFSIMMRKIIKND